jgi:Protein of unknown function (DUF2911)
VPRQFQPRVAVRTALFLSFVTAAGFLPAQTTLRSAPSTRATAEVTLSTPSAGQGQPAGAPVKVRIDYGQPHARGRVVEGALKADLDTVWRLGANNPTTLTTDVDLVIGNLTVPKGSYFLYARTSSTGAWRLIVNRNAGQSGAQHAREHDVGAVELAGKVLTTPIESFTLALVPGADGVPRGDLRISWGTREFTTTWGVK